MSGSFLVRLVRHAETASYEYDAGLTRRGRAQARDRAELIADTLPTDSRVDIAYAPTERARETAELLNEVLQQRAAHGRLNVGVCTEDSSFRNLQVTVNGAQYEPTQARHLIPGGGNWAREATALWASLDPMGFWMSTPMLSHEPPAAVVRRFLDAIAERTRRQQAASQLIVATHSGCMRALVAWAASADYGEPDNVEEVVVEVDPNDNQCRVDYRDYSWVVPLPASSEDALLRT